MLPRLAACFFSAIVDRGQFEDVFRYQRVLALLPMIRNWTALHALSAEHAGDLGRPTVIGNNMRKLLARGRMREEGSGIQSLPPLVFPS